MAGPAQEHMAARLIDAAEAGHHCTHTHTDSTTLCASTNQSLWPSPSHAPGTADVPTCSRPKPMQQGCIARALKAAMTPVVWIWSVIVTGVKWAVQIIRLALYATLLLPGFIQMIIFYFFSRRVNRGIRYGQQPRQRLDIYLPKGVQPGQTAPVVIYATGGAWTIGYRAWGALLAHRLSGHGVLVACLDYRNYPQGRAVDMLEDVNTGIAWALNNIGAYQGDTESITLVGQSAGAHLSCLAMLKQAELAATGVAPALGATPAWTPRALRAFVGVSGAFDLRDLCEHLQRRGLYRELVEAVMSVDGRPALDELSPVEAARALPAGSAAQLPEVLLMHGTADKTVPHEGSKHLHEALAAAGAICTLTLFPAKTHTSFLLEDPMRGGRDAMIDMILAAVTGSPQQHVYGTLCPGLLCDLAGWVCPF